MATKTSPEEKKWINSSVFIASAIVGLCVYSFLMQIGDWFELESRVRHFRYIMQGVSVVLSLGVCIFTLKYQTTATYLKEVYAEMVKVVFPEKQGNVRATIGIIIGVTIVGLFLGVFDYVVSELLNLLYT